MQYIFRGNKSGGRLSGGLWLGLLGLLFLLPPDIAAQEEDSLEFLGYVWMDSVVVTASRSGFNVDSFIRMVREDETFYQAFRNIRHLSYTAENDIRFTDKRGRQAARHHSRSRQRAWGDCRTMDFLDKEVEGNYYKGRRKRKLRYYTAKMYERLFFTRDTACQSRGETENPSASKGVERYVDELKTLIFRPGAKVDVPLIGGKTEIFSPDMIDLYDFSITSRTYGDSTDCYVFTAALKPEYQDRDAKAIVRFLETYFSKNDLQILARNYTLRYQDLLFHFDIDIGIRLKKIADLYVPSSLEYDGLFNVPMKKKERAWFRARFYDYE